MRETIFAALGQYLEREGDAWLADLDVPADTEPGQWIDAIAARRDLVALDAETDIVIAAALEKLPKDDRRTMLFDYLGYPFYDIATLPLLQGEGRSEEHTSETPVTNAHLVCRLLLEHKNSNVTDDNPTVQ